MPRFLSYLLVSLALLTGALLAMQGYLNAEDLWEPLQLPLEVIKLICILGWLPMLIAAVVSLVLKLRTRD